MKHRLTPIYAIESLSGFAGAMIGIFVPVYLLTIGLSVRDIMVFSLIQVFAGLVSIIAVSKASTRIPLKYFMLARIPTLVVFLGLLVAAKNHPVPIVLLASLEGLQFVLFYLPLHVFFTVATSSESIGKQVGTLLAIPKFFVLGAPLLAGVIAARWGFTPVFGLAAAFYALTAIPVITLPSYQAPFVFNLTIFRKLYRRYRTYFWLEVVENIQEEIDLVIWPLFVYLIVRNTIQAGAVSSLIAAGSALFTYLIGRRTDHADKFKLLRLGGFAMLALWLWRIAPLTPLTVFIISALVGFAGVLITVPFSAIIYNLARTNGPREFILFRETPLIIARILVYTLGIIVATNLQRLFWLAIAAYAIFAIMPRFNISPPKTENTTA